MNEVLDAREKRANHIIELMKEYRDKTIVIIKTNVPGGNKNPRNMVFICSYFIETIKSTFDSKILEYKKIHSLDGDYSYFVIDEEGNIVKEKTIMIEESTSLGRLIDIDVFNKNLITRSDLNIKFRTCLICEKPAYECSRSKAHSKQEIANRIQTIIEEFLTDFILNKTISSIYNELDLYPKYGLVSRKNSGCHTDMDASTFIKSIEAIKPFVKEYIVYGIHGLNDPYKLKNIGEKAEKAMFQTTSGINTHKGLIFALGVFLPAITKAIIRNENLNFIIKEISNTSEIIIGDYYKNLLEKENKTHGDIIYLKHKLKGLRGQALNGFRIIFTMPSYKNIPVIYRYHEYLIHIMSVLDDTTIIHKTNIETLKEVKSTFKDVLQKGGYSFNKELIKDISDSYIKRNISPGGSADLLVLKIIFEDLNHLIKTANIE